MNTQQYDQLYTSDSNLGYFDVNAFLDRMGNSSPDLSSNETDDESLYFGPIGNC